MLWHAVNGLYLRVLDHFPHVTQLNPSSQLGVRHHTRLRMEGHSRPYTLPMDDMGP